MEQYLTGSGGGSSPDGLFYYVSSPIPNATAADYGIPSNKLWVADEVNQTYPQFTYFGIPLEVGQGYVARMGSTGAITFDGSSFNTGAISLPGMTRTGTTETNRGYNLVGNPYPSTLSWDAAELLATNLETSMYYRTHQGTTMLCDTYNATSTIGTSNNGSAVTGNIPPTQAFWVRVDADGNTGQLDFSNSMRSHGTATSIYKVAAEEGTVRMTLSNGSVSDETIVLLNAEAQDSYDDFDSQKFWAAASVPQVYTTIGTDSLVINGLYSTVTNPVVDLGVKLPAAGDYSFNATSITLNEEVYLEDRLLSVFQNLNEEPNYSFTSTIGGNIPTRFALHFGMSVTGIQDETSSTKVYAFDRRITILIDENLIGSSADVLDLAGRVLRTEFISGTQTNLDMNVATGVYLVRVTTVTGIVSQRVFIK